MLSRVADSMYWIGRYLERAENTLRILDVNMNLMLEGSSMGSETRWRRVLRAFSTPVGMDEHDSDMTIESLTFDLNNQASIASCVAAARENARQVRDEMSSEQWQKLNSLYHQLSGMQTKQQRPMLSDAMQTILDGIYLFQGVTDTTMTHGDGWQFIRTGRFMERAVQTATLLELYYHELYLQRDLLQESTQYLEWVGLLRSCGAFECYCTTYTADLSPDRILEFLLLNRKFPHSLWYSVNAIVEALARIESDNRRSTAEELTRRAGRLRAMLSFAHIGEIIEQDAGVYLRQILNQCRMIQELTYRLYISYSIDTTLTT